MSQVRCQPKWGQSPTGDRCGDIVLAVYEAVVNAVEHAYRTPHDAPAHQHKTIGLDVLYRADTSSLQVTVADHGRWKLRAPTGVRGRGLILIRAVADSTHVDTAATGTTVTMQWNLVP
ncbi:ATP-binding protein [Rhodococcus sp. NPDC006774]|uniref:ATP-binding protein n=1 Tax=Nocardiaceae TaxID=85025 RepID=UPI000D7C5657